MRRPSRRRLLRGGLALAGLNLLAGGGVLPPRVQPKKLPRLGFLAPTAPFAALSQHAFLEALRDLGYVEGETILIEYRWAGGRSLWDELDAMALLPPTRRLRVEVPVLIRPTRLS